MNSFVETVISLSYKNVDTHIKKLSSAHCLIMDCTVLGQRMGDRIPTIDEALAMKVAEENYVRYMKL